MAEAKVKEEAKAHLSSYRNSWNISREIPTEIGLPDLFKVSRSNQFFIMKLFTDLNERLDVIGADIELLKVKSDIMKHDIDTIKNKPSSSGKDIDDLVKSFSKLQASPEGNSDWRKKIEEKLNSLQPGMLTEVKQPNFGWTRNEYDLACIWPSSRPGRSI